MNYSNINLIEETIGYEFKNKDLLIQAFTRRSWSRENHFSANNEVLEFLGDRVLDFIIIKRLAARFGEVTEIPKLYSDENGRLQIENVRNCFVTYDCDEGRLSKIKANIVCCNSLSSQIDRLELAQYLQVSRGDDISNVREEAHVKEDLFEAIIGAAALDCGWDIKTLDGIVDVMLAPDMLLDEGLSDEDYVGLVQSWYQKHKNGELPLYDIKETDGRFTAMIQLPIISGKYYGYGKSKRVAMSEAARDAWEEIRLYEESLNTVEAAVGQPDPARAINQLQELWQKKLIPEPEYVFEKQGCDDDGDDIWLCTCKVGTIQVGISGRTKAVAKREAAFVAISICSEEYLHHFSKGEK